MAKSEADSGIARRAVLASGAGFLAMGSSAWAAEDGAGPTVSIARDVGILARDAVRLSAVLYRPVGPAVKRPTLLAMTPYQADTWYLRAMYFASHGYNVVVVDHRGRGNSDGRFTPWDADGADGYDVVSWIAGQAWSDRQVGMIGGSYSGRNQWATAKAFPPALKTIVPTSANFIGFDNPMHAGIMSAWEINWYAGVYGRTQDKNFRDDVDQFSRVVRENYLNGGAFASLGDRLGMPSPVYDQWFSRPDLDAYWKSLSPTAADFHRMDIPILTITGQYDGVGLGAIEYYKRHQRAGGPAAAKHHLVIGPWNHSATRIPRPVVGGLHLGEASMVDIDRLHLDWFDWTLRGGDRPGFLRQKVMVYMTGSETWRGSPTLAEATTAVRKLFLGAGRLRPSSAEPSTAAITYDPADRRYGRSEPFYSEDFLLDTTPVDNLYGAGLVYETEAMTEPATLCGQASLTLSLTVDAPDTDLQATLYEIDAAGTSLKLCTDYIRLRYRNSYDRPEPMPLGRQIQVKLPDFTFVARRLPVGSRIRLLIRSMDSIYDQKNYNSGGNVYYETIADARIVHVQLAEGGSMGSVLELPVAI